MLVYTVLLLGVAASIVLPTKPKSIVPPERWFSMIDVAAVAGAKSTTTTFDVSISEEGRPVGCEIIIRSGVEGLDERVCTAVFMKARFSPAEDVTGRRVPAVIRERLAWRPTGSGPSEWLEEPDYVIEVPTFAQRMRKFAAVAVAYGVNGKVEACHVIKSSEHTPLDEQACRYALTNHTRYPMLCIVCERKPVLRFLKFGFVHGSTGSIQAR